MIGPINTRVKKVDVDPIYTSAKRYTLVLFRVKKKK